MAISPIVGYGAWHDGGLSKLGKISFVVGALPMGVAPFSFGMNGLLLGMAMSVTAVMEVLEISLAETLGGTPENAVTSAWLSQ